MTARSERRQHAGEDLEPEVLFVAEPVGAALEDADLVVQPLDEAGRDLVLRTAVRRDPVPVPINLGMRLAPVQVAPTWLRNARMSRD
jgi:hypothetical protein